MRALLDLVGDTMIRKSRPNPTGLSLSLCQEHRVSDYHTSHTAPAHLSSLDMHLQSETRSYEFRGTKIFRTSILTAVCILLGCETYSSSFIGLLQPLERHGNFFSECRALHGCRSLCRVESSPVKNRQSRPQCRRKQTQQSISCPSGVERILWLRIRSNQKLHYSFRFTLNLIATDSRCSKPQTYDF